MSSYDIAERIVGSLPELAAQLIGKTVQDVITHQHLTTSILGSIFTVGTLYSYRDAFLAEYEGSSGHWFRHPFKRKRRRIMGDDDRVQVPTAMLRGADAMEIVTPAPEIRETTRKRTRPEDNSVSDRAVQTKGSALAAAASELRGKAIPDAVRLHDWHGNRNHPLIRYKYPSQTYDVARELMKILAPVMEWTRFENIGEITSAVGRQGVISSLAGQGGYWKIADRFDLEKIWDKLKDCYVLGASNVSSYLAGGQTNSSPPLLCLGWKRTYKISNRRTTSCTLEIWDLVARQRTDLNDQTPQTTWTEDLDIATSGSTGSYGLQAGLGDNPPTKGVAGVELTLDKTFPGMRPRPHDIHFHKFYIVKRKTVYVLPPNGTIMHVVDIPGFALSTNEILDSDSNTDANILGITQECLLFLQGEECFDDTAGVQQKSITASSCVCRMDEKLVFRVIPRTRKKFKWTTHRNGYGDVTFTDNDYAPVAAVPYVMTSGSAETKYIAPSNPSD